MTKKIEPTETPWTLHVQGEPNQYAILGPDGKWVLGLLHNGEQLPAQQEANLRRIVHAVNTHAALLDGIQKAIETFADFERANAILGRDVMAAAALIAKNNLENLLIETKEEE